MAVSYWDALTRKPTSKFNFAEGLLGLLTKGAAERRLGEQEQIAAIQDAQRYAAAQNTNGALMASAVPLSPGGDTSFDPATQGFGQYLDQDAYGNPIGTTYDEQGNISTYPGEEQDNPYLSGQWGNQSQGAITTTGEGEIPNVQWFSYDWEAEQQKAFDALKPFYEKLIGFVNGNLDLAKRVLAYTYQSGMREAKQSYEFDTGQLDELFPEENRQLVTNLNKRGVYFSGFGKEDMGTLDKSQQRRRLAVERALEGRTSDLGAQREFELEKQSKGAEEQLFNLERQKKKEADQMAADKYSIESQKFEAELGKQQQAEQRRTTSEANKTLMGAIGGTGSTSKQAGYGSGEAEFRRFMQSTGKQAELDKATMGGQQQGAPFYNLMKQYRF